MGGCLSGFAPVHLIDSVDGDEDDYQQRFLEDSVLGQGEFGIVKLVHDMESKKKYMLLMNNQNPSEPVAEEPKPLACKVLQKGVIFKDNVLYSPLKPHVLKGEIDMLRILAGDCYCLKLFAVYESPKRLYVITECCTGGVMTQYVAAQGQSFTTDDVSRIAFQLLSAVNHCAQYRIIHRDIKPDNILFTNAEPGADIRLIDFGSGCMDPKHVPKADDPENESKTQYVNGFRVHETFAGSAFYISPEVFNRSYTAKTDVWSIGATLYVLVAGYPADALQPAFNILQCDKRDLRTLPNLPHNLPDSFYDLLEGCLTYWYKQRPTARKLLQCDFVTLHQIHLAQEVSPGDDTVSSPNLRDGKADASTVDLVSSMRRVNSVSLLDSVFRHNLVLDFQKYELSVTTLLATLLSKADLEKLLIILNSRVTFDEDGIGDFSTDIVNSRGFDNGGQKLAVIPISDLKTILRDDIKNIEMYVCLYLVAGLLNSTDSLACVCSSAKYADRASLDNMGNLANSNLYDSFAYHTVLLNEFSVDGFGRRHFDQTTGLASSEAGGGIHQMTGSNTSSVYSVKSLRLKHQRSTSVKGARRGSVQGTNMFKSIRTKKRLQRSLSTSV
jgi:calcium/calmodulin-dependent protein kinase I